MVIGILQIEIAIDGASSLKDKRRVVRSLKDRLHREHQVSVAEVDRQDNATVAVLGIALASTSVPHAQRVLDGIVNKLRHGRDWTLNDHRIELLTGQ